MYMICLYRYSPIIQPYSITIRQSLPDPFRRDDSDEEAEEVELDADTELCQAGPGWTLEDIVGKIY